MVAKEDILVLKTKILPPGADIILDFLAARHHQVEMTHIVLENVPLVIIGRHGMIARIPVGGVLQKVSQTGEILDLLQTFLQKPDNKLYLFVNLPDLPLPVEVTQLLQEVQARAARKEQLYNTIDEALDRRDREAFMRATEELKQLLQTEWNEDSKDGKHRRVT
ncbi:MAG: IDEAL domain-containing protein [Alicyclobacillaceae bacterium]|nr:IDEAL domain-containing protein [Alicyclobacillaceae bacterium]